MPSRHTCRSGGTAPVIFNCDTTSKYTVPSLSRTMCQRNLPCWGVDSADGRVLVKSKGTHCHPFLRRSSTDQADLSDIQTWPRSPVARYTQSRTFRHNHRWSLTSDIGVGITHAQMRSGKTADHYATPNHYFPIGRTMPVIVAADELLSVPTPATVLD